MLNHAIGCYKVFNITNTVLTTIRSTHSNYDVFVVTINIKLMFSWVMDILFELIF